MLRTLSVILCFCAANVAQATDKITPEDFDTDKSGVLIGDEILEFERSLKQSNNKAAGDWLRVINQLEADRGKDFHIAIEDLKARIDFLCDKGQQKIFIRKSFSDLPILRCPEVTGNAEGASVSFSGDIEAEENVISIEGLIAYPIISPKVAPSIQDEAREAAGLDTRKLESVETDSAFLIFAQADGTINFGSTDRGFTRFGGSYYSRFENSISDRDTFNLSAYFHSDLELEADGYGVLFTYLPVFEGEKIDINLPPAQTKIIDKHGYIATNFTADWINLNDPGNTNLTADTDFLWLGGEIGLVFTDKPETLPNGYTARAGIEYFYDTLNSQEAFQFVAGLDFQLDRSGRSSLGITYIHGEQRQDLEFENKIEVNFKFKQ